MSAFQTTFLQIVHPTKDTCKMLTLCILKNYNIRETIPTSPRRGHEGGALVITLGRWIVTKKDQPLAGPKCLNYASGFAAGAAAAGAAAGLAAGFGGS